MLTMGTALYVGAYRYGMFDKLLDRSGYNNFWSKSLATLSTSLVANYSVSSWFKNAWATAIDGATYFVTGRNYNPIEAKPIATVNNLKGKLTCPILIHQCKHDGILENPDKDTVTLYDALKNGKTHIYLSEDGDHNWPSDTHKNVRYAFHTKYGFSQWTNPIKEEDINTTLANTTPTIEELQSQVCK